MGRVHQLAVIAADICVGCALKIAGFRHQHRHAGVQQRVQCGNTSQNIAGQIAARRAEVTDILRCTVHNFQRAPRLRVAVGVEGDITVIAGNQTAAVGSALHTDLAPQVGKGQNVDQNRVTTAELPAASLEIGSLDGKADRRRNGQPLLPCTPRRIDRPFRRRAALRQSQDIQPLIFHIVRAGNRHTAFRKNPRCQHLHRLQHGVQRCILGSGLLLQPNGHLSSAEILFCHTPRRIVRSHTNLGVLFAVVGQAHLGVQRRLTQAVTQQLAVRKLCIPQNFCQQFIRLLTLLWQTRHARHQLHTAVFDILTGQGVDLKVDSADFLLDQHLQFLAAVLFCPGNTQQHTHGGQHRQFLFGQIVCLKVDILIHKAVTRFMAQHRYITMLCHGNGQILRFRFQVGKLQHRYGPDCLLAVGSLLPAGQFLRLFLQFGALFGRPGGGFCRQTICLGLGLFGAHRMRGHQHSGHAVALVQEQFTDEVCKQIRIQVGRQFFQRLIHQQRPGGVAAVQPTVQHGQRLN